MGYVAFKKAKQLTKMKFQYRASEKQTEISGTTLKYGKFFKTNPDLIEFMKLSSKVVEEKDEPLTP